MKTRYNGAAQFIRHTPFLLWIWTRPLYKPLPFLMCIAPRRFNWSNTPAICKQKEEMFTERVQFSEAFEFGRLCRPPRHFSLYPVWPTPSPSSYIHTALSFFVGVVYQPANVVLDLLRRPHKQILKYIILEALDEPMTFDHIRVHCIEHAGMISTNGNAP
jgi:hypothetical protein